MIAFIRRQIIKQMKQPPAIVRMVIAGGRDERSVQKEHIERQCTDRSTNDQCDPEYRLRYLHHQM